jgi:ABC-type Fe3+ transport system permease subunit
MFLQHIPFLIAALGGRCTPKGGSFLGFPTWYKYLPGIETFNGQVSANVCLPRIQAINDVWLIAAAIVEILLRIAGLVAIAFVIMGGAKYMMSRGEPDKTSGALQTIINALIGLVIAIASTILVTFIAGRFTK